MGIAEELAAMDKRISELEDKLAIMQVVAGYGPSVDGGAAREAGSLWTTDSWYDTDSSPAAATPHGRVGIEEAAKRFFEDPVGLAHISHMPLIKVEGDRATVVNHSNTFHQEGDGFRIGRVSSNRWDLVRVDGNWQIERRINRLLNGSRESKDVLADGTREILGE
jgi:SnoaL-like domain